VRLLYRLPHSRVGPARVPGGWRDNGWVPGAPCTTNWYSVYHGTYVRAPEPGEQVPSQDDHPWNPQTRTTTETVLREAMQALVRVQAHTSCLRGLWWRSIRVAPD
jgi:hypothetical protein